MWDPPGPGLEPVSPALAGGFLTAGPPGSPPAVASDTGAPAILLLLSKIPSLYTGFFLGPY